MGPLKYSIRKFVASESGAVSLDWLVLTGVIAATGLAVVGTVSSGVELTSIGSASALQQQVTEQSFGTDLCPGGRDSVAERESERIAVGGGEPIDVDNWELLYGGRLSDGDLLRERDRLVQINAIDGGEGSGPSRSDILQDLLECDLAARGLD